MRICRFADSPLRRFADSPAQSSTTMGTKPKRSQSNSPLSDILRFGITRSAMKERVMKGEVIPPGGGESIRAMSSIS